MKIRKGTVVVAILLAFTVSVSALAQRRNQQQQQQQQQRGGQADAPAQQLGPQPTSKEELDAFVALQSEQNAAAKLAKGDEFVAKFPTSDFISYAHTFRMMSLTQMGKHKESAAAAEQALNSTIKLGEKMIAKADADSKLTDKDKDNARKKDKNVVFLDKNSPQFQQFMSQMDQRIMAFYQSLLERLRVLPGVQTATVTSRLPLENGGWDTSFLIEGQPVPPPHFLRRQFQICR